MKRSHGRRPASGRPHASHRRPRARLSRPRLAFRLVTAVGFAALLGVGIAIGAGAVQMPSFTKTAKATTATTAAAAPAKAEAAAVMAASANPEGFAIATLPRRAAAHDPKASHPPSGKATAKPASQVAMTPAQSPPSSQPAYTPAAPQSSQSAGSSQSASSQGLTPQPTAEYQTPTGQNQLAWSDAILNALGDPLTSANIVSIGYWMQNEAGKPPYGIVGANNPINVSEPGYGGTQIQYEAPGYYLMSYPTVQDGVQATAAYLNNGSYPRILNDLKQGIGLMSDSSLASELNEYSGGGYSAIPDSWGASQGKPQT